MITSELNLSDGSALDKYVCSPCADPILIFTLILLGGGGIAPLEGCLVSDSTTFTHKYKMDTASSIIKDSIQVRNIVCHGQVQVIATPKGNKSK